MKDWIRVSFLSLLLIFAACSKVNGVEGVSELDTAGIQKIVKNSSGKVVLVNFWATWCPPCRAEIPELIKMREKYSDDDLVMIGVSVDETSDAVDDFIKVTGGMNYPVYHASADIGPSFRIQAIPFTVIYDPDGKQIFARSGGFPIEMFENLIDKYIKDKK
ncbi:TlpA family protein disulfide reductase [Maridesulfovibrio bastinii]|uniref:TlpA family protein disulfide reductase n=1 Tax=Maridesulfovibrio bastinii TaxID=47157 RepID=UPI000427DCD1|nr:TlpA disulfide reductase family protein [Maridesulfovibrio bastinii]